jgi:hypothetical protein
MSRRLVLEGQSDLSLPAKFFADFNRHFGYAPITRLDVVASRLKNKMATIGILKFPYTSLVMLIPGYKMSTLFAFAVNQ